MEKYILTIKLTPDIWHLDSNIEILNVPTFQMVIEAKDEKEALESAKKIEFNFNVIKCEKYEE